ncbi:hypothetical protein V1508DRAFT_425037 [Lipomyces doorenjongii]|uniref:uncharacterized protein n=1 Tax=Lipomyces doorenjongii TaxID=383834 RepID=UPI0034CE5EA7
MDQVEVIYKDSQYCRKCPSCRRQIRCDTLQELANVFAGLDGQAFRSCLKCRSKVSLLLTFRLHEVSNVR